MILAIAVCGRTSTFDWDNNRAVLPPQDTFGFIIEHYMEFNLLTVPMWMWLSICIQAVMEEEIPPPGSMPGNFENVFLDVFKNNTYNTVAEWNKILVWFKRHLIPDGIWHSVDHGPFTYHKRYISLSLATFLAVIKQGRSFDNSSVWMEGSSHLPLWFLTLLLMVQTPGITHRSHSHYWTLYPTIPSYRPTIYPPHPICLPCPSRKGHSLSPLLNQPTLYRYCQNLW
jgi:hypothetical protein